MPKRSGQVKLEAGLDHMTLLKQATVGGFHEAAYAFVRGNREVLDAMKNVYLWREQRPSKFSDEERRLVFTPSAKELELGELLLRALVREDAGFFRGLAKVITEMPRSGKRESADPILEELLSIKDELTQGLATKPTTAELHEWLLHRGIKCQLRDVQSRVRKIGLPVNSRRGPKPGANSRK